MTVKKLIEKLNKFNPDGNLEVQTHSRDADEGLNEYPCCLCLEEDPEGSDKLIVVIHTCD